MTQQATTPFVETAEPTMTGLGAPILSFFDVTALTATGTITLNLANAGINAVPITKGRLRIKTTAVNAATTTAIGAVSVTDGTNTVQASAALLAVTAVGTAIDIHIDIYSELQVNSISFTVTLAGSATVATVSTEFFANP